PAAAQDKTIWSIGKADKSSAEMALAPAASAHFLDNDFGWEDRYFLLGFSNVKKDWPYALPGPKNAWGGTGPTSGTRSNVLNILFGLSQIPAKAGTSLIIDLAGYDSESPALFKVLI